jgi:phosphate transport system permease protein
MSVAQRDVGRPDGPPIEVQPAPRPRNAGDRLFHWMLTAGAGLTPLLILLFVAVLCYGAWPSIKEFGFRFLTTLNWEPNPDREEYGALAFLLGTLESSLLALAIAAPIGITVATFTTEVLAPRWQGPLRFVIETLAVVPSVVYGLWGVFVMAPWISRSVAPLLANSLGRFIPLFSGPIQPRNMFCAGLILAIMILPLIMSISMDAMRAIPRSYREAALGLGATRWEMIRVAVWPAAKSSFIAACIMALGRALGETMAVTMVIGNGEGIALSLFAPSNTIASNIANQFNEAPSELFTAALIELAFVLFAITLLVNFVARWLLGRGDMTGMRV